MSYLGIDLGTTNSVVAIYESGQPRILPSVQGKSSTPSVVGLADDRKTVLVGEAARARLISHADLTAARFKRIMGTNKLVRLGKKTYGATQLSAIVLAALKSDAEAALGRPVSDAVISVPAYFNAVQRQATKDAAEIAGLNVIRLINEPTAAALAAGVLDRAGESRFVVLDLGGGTFDVTILEMFDGVMEVRASAGDAQLGGEDFTGRIGEHFAKELGIDWVKAKTDQRERFLAAAERVKQALSSQTATTITVQVGGKDHTFEFDRTTFEFITSDLINRMRRPIERVLYDSGLEVGDIERVILVGGATRMPVVRSLASRVFRRLPEQVLDPDLAIAQGAAVQAALASRSEDLDDLVMTDVCPFTLGIETSAMQRPGHMVNDLFAPIIERNTPLPASRSAHFSTLQANQRQIVAQVLQGESARASENVHLGSVEIPVPPGPAGSQSIEVRLTYDVSGLLAVDVTSLSSGMKVSSVIDNLAQALSPAEKAKRLREMEALKINPREEAENVALVAAIGSLHEMVLGDDRVYVRDLLLRFELALESQDRKFIASERADIAAQLNRLEAILVR
ncbi:Hsp70 family protein [Pelagibacterium halotolerans]|uniref:Hsp70 family protein n=1 Tax=Pelagibacterium halotolerans TaxID=531813 RepID=UPI00384D5BD5